MARKTASPKWKQMDNGRWACSLGMRGATVRLFQKRKGGSFYRAVYCPGRGISRACIGTADKGEAVHIGLLLVAGLLRDELPAVPGSLTLKTLCDQYSAKCQRFGMLNEASKNDGLSRMKILIGHFGDSLEVDTITEDLFYGFQKARERGGIPLGDGRFTKAVRTRSVQADFKLLHAMLRWAVTFRVAGKTLLDRDPLFGKTAPKAKGEPRSETATQDRFEKTRAAICALRDRSGSEAAMMKWTRLEMAVVLVEATGRRIGSVRKLHWADVNVKEGWILWRAENDKQKVQRGVPMSPTLRADMERFSILLDGNVGGLLFPRPQNPLKAIRREKMDRALAKAEKHAGIAKLDGTLWHAYRRAWATGCDDVPIQAGMYAGGWKDAPTFLKYQKVTPEALMKAVSERKPVTSVVGR